MRSNLSLMSATVGGVIVAFSPTFIAPAEKKVVSDTVHDPVEFGKMVHAATTETCSQIELQALVGGDTVRFDDIEKKFVALVNEAARLREPGSSTSSFFNDGYGQIAGMGERAIGFVLEEMQKQRGHWSTLLTWLTGVDMANGQNQGNARKIREAWLQWGKDNGYIDSDGKRIVV